MDIFSRMMRLNEKLKKMDNYEFHYFSKGDIYQKLLDKFPEEKENIHEVLMPTPIDGKFGPSLRKSLWNFFSRRGKQATSNADFKLLKDEGKLYNKIGFDLVINDGDMGSNVLQKDEISQVYL